MKVISLKTRNAIYCCNAYLVVGDAKRAENVNGLIDVGTDGEIVRQVEESYVGVRERPVERVVLTHTRVAYENGLKAVAMSYRPEVYAVSMIEGVKNLVVDGQILRMGACDFEVMVARAHAHESLLLYCEREGVLFSGDIPLNVRKPGGTYEPSYVDALEIIAERDINTIYPAYGEPVMDKAEVMIRTTLLFVRQSGIAVV